MPFDYEQANPNLKALRRILFAFIAAAALCFTACMMLIARAKPPHHPSQATPARCVCGGHCKR
jgi:hypothetical protein